MGRLILVVDDEMHLRELVQACLEDLAGWDTLAAASGEECLQILQSFTTSEQRFADSSVPVGAILLDVSMPGMDGFAVYEKLQENPATQTIPVILLTAKVLPSDRRKFEQMGVTGVISKPIEPMTLMNEVAEILGWDK